MKPFDPRTIPDDRPATMDEKGRRILLHPAAVTGFFRRWRDRFYDVLLIIFLVIPWTRIGGHQTVLLDLGQRRFSLFGVTFWAHDVPLVFFVLTLSAIGLMWVTAVWGRLWCGWACPQTVFIDRVYRRIETWVEGPHLRRVKRDLAPWDAEKVRVKLTKWFLYFIASSLIAHSFAAYFLGAERLMSWLAGNPTHHWTEFLVVCFLTALVWFDFGWFREQFCMIACPYGRFQSVLMDVHSLAPLYDGGRGEPRRGQGAGTGDCVNCFRCVAVCPTGIDIRSGLQMECVACTACIDACDEVMQKVGSDPGLIRYDSLAGLRGQKKGLRPRVLIYAVVWTALLVGFVYSLIHRRATDIRLLRAVESPYTTKTLENGTVQVVNHFRLKVTNQSFVDQTISIATPEGQGDLKAVSPALPASLLAGKTAEFHVFFTFSQVPQWSEGKAEARLSVQVDQAGRVTAYEEHLPLLGPVKLP